MKLISTTLRQQKEDNIKHFYINGQFLKISPPIGSTRVSYWGCTRLQISVQPQGFVTYSFHDFPQAFHGNDMIIPQKLNHNLYFSHYFQTVIDQSPFT
jgi:hypothetical protein